MSVIEKDVVDGIGIIAEGAGLSLMISDHLDWEDEYNHLMTLQEKINNYIAFCENRQYTAIYKDQEFLYAVFEIHFLHEPTKNAVKFLNQVQEQIGELGIKIECYVE